MTPAQAALDDILTQGIQVELFRAEQCFALRLVIAERADAINTASYGDLFGNLQQILYQFAVLSVAKVFERPSSDYPLRSLPAALAHLRTNAATLDIVNKSALIKSLVQLGLKEEELDQLTSTQFTTALCDAYTRRLPKSKKSSDNLMCQTLYAIKTVRDKFISHAEHISLADLPDISSEGTTKLIQFATEFLLTLGRGYLSVSYTDSAGTFLRTTNAATASRGLERLLKTPGLLPSP